MDIHEIRQMVKDAPKQEPCTSYIDRMTERRIERHLRKHIKRINQLMVSEAKMGNVRMEYRFNHPPIFLSRDSFNDNVRNEIYRYYLGKRYGVSKNDDVRYTKIKISWEFYYKEEENV